MNHITAMLVTYANNGNTKNISHWLTINDKASVFTEAFVAGAGLEPTYYSPLLSATQKRSRKSLHD
jgi:hypothetical protein